MRTRIRDLESEVVRAAIAFVDSFELHDETMGTDVKGERYLELQCAVRSALEHMPEAITLQRGIVGHDHPETAQDAATLAGLVHLSTRHKIVAAIRGVVNGPKRGLTDDELETRLKMSHTTVSSARNALVTGGWLTDSGLKRETRASLPHKPRWAIVWTLTSAARDVTLADIRQEA